MAILEIEDLIKHYRSPDGEKIVVVEIPRFTMQTGEQIALRGESGCGKTTFLHLIAGIATPTSGRILFDGRNLVTLSESHRDKLRAQSIGYVFQTFHLLPGYSALENVLLGMLFGEGLDRDRAQKLLERLGLGDRMHFRPPQLSIGQQQRVALARALANRPRLVLADEPTGNLDPVHKTAAIRLIRDSCEEAGAALLLVSHDSSVLGEFRRVEDMGQLNRAFAIQAAEQPEA